MGWSTSETYIFANLISVVNNISLQSIMSKRLHDTKNLRKDEKLRKPRTWLQSLDQRYKWKHSLSSRHSWRLFEWARHNQCNLLLRAVERGESCISPQKTKLTNSKFHPLPRQHQAPYSRSNILKTTGNPLNSIRTPFLLSGLIVLRFPFVWAA